jgi:C1A family cysteine protease
MMGLRDAQTADVRFEVPLRYAPKAALPRVRDWRDHEGRNWVSPMLNQGNCGSCVSFAAIGVFETQTNITALIPDLNRRFSTQYLFGCGYFLENSITLKECTLHQN